MNDVVERLRERGTTVTAPPVATDWARLRRARRLRSTRFAAGTTVGVVVLIGATAVGYHAVRNESPAVLAVTAPPEGRASTGAPAPVASTPLDPSPLVPADPPASDVVEEPLTSYAGRSLAQLAQECQASNAGVTTPGSDPQIRGLVADSAGAVAAITTDTEASTCEFLPDGSVDTSGASDGPYGPHNPADRLVTQVDEITLGSGITHRLDSKDRGLKTPIRSTLVARVSSNVAYVVVNFGGHTVRSTPGQGVVTATRVTDGNVTNANITYTAYDQQNHVITTSKDAVADYGSCDPRDGTKRNDPTACPVIPWP